MGESERERESVFNQHGEFLLGRFASITLDATTRPVRVGFEKLS